MSAAQKGARENRENRQGGRRRTTRRGEGQVPKGGPPLAGVVALFLAVFAVLLGSIRGDLRAQAATTPAQSGTAAVNGTKLYYEVAGQGHAMVLLHGGAVDRRAWDDQFGAFAARYRVIRYDLRGAGRSASAETPFSNSEDLYALLRHLRVDKACLLGISRGGGIAFDFTLEHPEMVDALVLISSNLSHTPAAYREMFERTTEAGRQRGAAAAAQVWGNDPYQGPVREAARPRVLQVLEENLPRFRHFDGSMAVRQLSSSETPRSERLSEIRVPTLVIAGARDNEDARANYDRWAAGIPNAKKVVFPNAAHLVNIDQPEEFNRAVLEFLDKL